MRDARRRNRHEYEEHPLPRGTLTETILDVLSRGAEMTGALFDGVAGEITNFSMRPRYHSGSASSGAGTDFAASYRESKSFFALLSKLKRDGFVANTGTRRKFIWHITREGRKKLAELRERTARRSVRREFPFPAPDGKLRIVTYDVPERERNKRLWLRGVLGEAEYELLQRSVWIGRRPLPEEFFSALRRQGILACVHMIEVGKSGTIRQVA